ncbi:MAG: hypothetical protein WBG15_08230, partial [Xanthobacteraceae bacterium]
MIARSGIDDRVGGARFIAHQDRVIERADHGLDAMGRNRIGFSTVANQAANPMTRTDQRHRRRAADIAVCTGDENLHGTFLNPPLRKGMRTRQIVLAARLGVRALQNKVHGTPQRKREVQRREAPGSWPRHAGECYHSLALRARRAP